MQPLFLRFRRCNVVSARFGGFKKILQRRVCKIWGPAVSFASHFAMFSKPPNLAEIRHGDARFFWRPQILHCMWNRRCKICFWKGDSARCGTDDARLGLGVVGCYEAICHICVDLVNSGTAENHQQPVAAMVSSTSLRSSACADVWHVGPCTPPPLHKNIKCKNEKRVEQWFLTCSWVPFAVGPLVYVKRIRVENVTTYCQAGFQPYETCTQLPHTCTQTSSHTLHPTTAYMHPSI